RRRSLRLLHASDIRISHHKMPELTGATYSISENGFLCKFSDIPASWPNVIDVTIKLNTSVFRVRAKIAWKGDLGFCAFEIVEHIPEWKDFFKKIHISTNAFSEERRQKNRRSIKQQIEKDLRAQDRRFLEVTNENYKQHTARSKALLKFDVPYNQDKISLARRAVEDITGKKLS